MLSLKVNDERGGAHTSAQLTVESLNLVGLFAFALQNELVNTAALTGVSVTSTITTYGVYNNAAYSDAVVTASCSLADSSAVSILSVTSSCVASVTSTHWVNHFSPHSFMNRVDMHILNVLVCVLLCFFFNFPLLRVLPLEVFDRNIPDFFLVLHLELT